MVSVRVGGLWVPVEKVIEMFSGAIPWSFSWSRMVGSRTSTLVSRNESETTIATVSEGLKAVNAWLGRPMGLARDSLRVEIGSGRGGDWAISSVSR